MPDRIRILDVKDRMSFRTIYEAINWCAGTDYKYWGRACWPSNIPEGSFRLWFTQLAHIEKGRLVPSINEYLNLLCSDGNYFVFDYVGSDKTRYTKGKAELWESLLFTKDVGGEYIFRGVFVRDEKKTTSHHYVFRRIATKVKLIGCPARKIELLDSIDAKVEFDKDYLKNNTVVDGKGTVVLSVSPIDRKTKVEILRKSTVTKPKEPDKVSDEECLAMYPIGCRVSHNKFGEGVVKSVSEGVIIIEFKGKEKKLGVDFCVKNKILKTL